MILKDDRPYEAQDDGRLSIDDVRNVDVDQFDLRSNKESTVVCQQTPGTHFLSVGIWWL